MKDIYSEIRDKMNNSLNIKATEKNWNSFLAHRESRDVIPSKKAVWPYWTIGLLLLLFGLSNGYWMFKNSSNDIQYDNLISSTDTIYITKYVDKIDTTSTNDLEPSLDGGNVKKELAIIKNKYFALKSQIEDQKTRFSQLHVNNQGLEHRFRDLQNQLYTINTNSSVSIVRNLNFEPKVLKENIPSFDSKLEERLFYTVLGQLPRLGLDMIEGNQRRVIHPASIIVIKNKKPFNLIEAITPKSLSINSNIGYVINPSSDDYKGLAFDFRATSLFSSQLRGFAGLTFIESKLGLDENDSTNPNIPYPMLSVEDRIEHANQITSQLSFTLGMEYLLNLDNRWRPFAGVCYGRVFMNSAKYSFEIYDANGNEYYITPESKNALGSYNQIIFTLGTDFNISNRIDMRLGVNYTHSLQNKFNSIFFLKAGAYYHF